MCVNFSHFPINIFIFYFQVWIESALLPSTNVSGGVDVAVAEIKPGTVTALLGDVTRRTLQSDVTSNMIRLWPQTGSC